MHCDLPGSNEKMVVQSDADMLQMFSLHTNPYKKFVHVHVELETVENLNMVYEKNGAMRDGERDGCPRGAHVSGGERDGGERGGRVRDGGERGGRVRDGDEEDEDDRDYIFGFSLEDEEWEDENEGYSSNSGLVDEGTMGEVQISSDDGLSNYGSGDECGSESSIEILGDTDKKDRAKGKAFDQCLFGIEFHRVLGQKIELVKGHLFDNIKKFREVLRDYAIQECFKMVRKKIEKARIRCHCAATSCPWMIHASPLFDKITYQIKTINKEHTCVKESTFREATSTWIAMKFADRIRENPEIKIASLGAAVKTQYGIEPSRMQLYRAKRKALEEIGGNHAEAYTLLPAYANEIDKTNPGSLAKIKRFRANLYMNPVFSRIFICFEALATGLKKGCRPFIGLDGCHLKGPYGGVLLTATALDGNNGLFPSSLWCCGK
ncbi:uncharacterized protein LOC132306663 isoform X1 [Cornus florida]|uniref:uncharacterized protein LOC132306663 isoform X1 n=1 Tax=Cornus florida TaxID=4283 RepID=UPI0028975840|nr:uncharacterized protein LOC132306663 isoform X1 [Cornus florida]